MNQGLLTPVHGGHVWPGPWEDFIRCDEAQCAACGRAIRAKGFFVIEAIECSGWTFGDTTDPILPRVVRAITREAPNDKPNGPVEVMVEKLHAAHLEILGAHDGVKMFVSFHDVKAEGDVIARFVDALADQDRALRLALEADAAQADRDEAPYVCPDPMCAVVGDAPHVRGCTEESLEREANGEDDPPDDD